VPAFANFPKCLAELLAERPIILIVGTNVKNYLVGKPERYGVRSPTVREGNGWCPELKISVVPAPTRTIHENTRNSTKALHKRVDT